MIRYLLCIAVALAAAVPVAVAVDPANLPYVDRVHLQQALIVGRWLKGTADGAIGPKTREAVRRFEESAGNTPDGDLSPTELEHLMLGRSNPDGFELLPNQDLDGFDYRSGMDDSKLANLSLSQCQSLCSSDGQCSAYTYNVAAQICFLKGTGAVPSEFAGAISGRRLSGSTFAQSQPDPAPVAPVALDCSALPQDPQLEAIGAELAGRIYDVSYGYQAGPGELVDLLATAREILPRVEERALRDMKRLIPAYELLAYGTTPCLEVSKATTAALLNIFLSSGTKAERDRLLDFAVIHSLNEGMFATDINGAASNAFNLLTVRFVRPDLFRQAASYIVSSGCLPDEPPSACTMDTFAGIYDNLDRGMVALDFRREAFRLADQAAPNGPGAIRLARALAQAEWDKGSVSTAQDLLRYGVAPTGGDMSSWDYRDRDSYTALLLELDELSGDDAAMEQRIITTIEDRLREEATIAPGSTRVMNTAEPTPLVQAYIMGEVCRRCSAAVGKQVLRWVRSQAIGGSPYAFLMLRNLPANLVSEAELERSARHFLTAIVDGTAGLMDVVPAEELSRITRLRGRSMTDAELATVVALGHVHPQMPSPLNGWLGDFAQFMFEDNKAQKRRYYDGLLTNHFSHLEEFGGDEGYVEQLDWTAQLTRRAGYAHAAMVFDEHAVRIFEKKIELIGTSPDVVAAARAEDAEQLIPSLVRLARYEGVSRPGAGRERLRAAHEMALETLTANWRTGDQRMIIKLQRLQAALAQNAELAVLAARDDSAMSTQAFESMQLAMLGSTAITAQAAQRQRVLVDPAAQRALAARDAASEQLQMFNYYRASLAIGDPEFEQTEVARLTDDLATADKVLEQYLPSRTLVGIAPLALSEVKELLRPNEALLVLHAGTEELVGSLVLQTGEPVFWSAPIPAAELTSRIAAIRQTVEPQADGTLPLGFPFADAHELLKQLLGPALDTASGFSRLVIVVDGPLQSLPFSILPTRVPEHAPATVDDFRSPEIGWLGADKALIYLPTVSSLRDRAIQGTTAARPFVGFGNPVLNSEAGFATKAERSGLVNGTSINSLTPLPETQVEVFALAHLSGASRDDVFVAADASETKLKSAPLSDYRVLLFATHGLMAGELDDVDEPGLIFTPPQVASVLDDGYLGLSEIMGLKLNADLVILSACNTAAGDGSADASGLSGLARGFLSAGARSVAVTHWSVPSAATLSLNVKWFGARQADAEADWAETLRRAIVAMTQSEGPAAFAHPANWGAFEIFGSPV